MGGTTEQRGHVCALLWDGSLILFETKTGAIIRTDNPTDLQKNR